MKKIGFIGFGLIGGSLAKIWHRNHPETSIIVWNHHKEKNPEYEKALEDGVIKEITKDFSSFALCDLIILCTPVISIVHYLELLKDVVKEDTIITDVGSVKSLVMDAAEGFGLSQNFIGGHPMAGSEKTGYSHADSNLFENSYYILTPFRDTAEEKLTILKELISETRALPVIVDAARHDEVTAAISHVPHIVASSLVNAVAGKQDNMMEMLAAGGFRDITRIASSSPGMWRDICVSNKDSIGKFLSSYIEALQLIKHRIEEGDKEEIFNFFGNSKEFRDSLPLKKSNMAVSHEILLYVPDEPGEIAIIASILAARGISIKNIGIAHNREYSEGVLRVEFYDHFSKEAAYKAIKERNYMIFDS